MDLAERVDSLPATPGVYLFKSARGAVLYVGKAQNLRQRVRQYTSGGDGRHSIPALMERAADVEVVQTPSVKDALLLENELIKRHKPAFNVRLRDDKQYLGLRLDPSETWPRLTGVRRFRKNNAKDSAQYFGPYTSSVSLKEALKNLRRIFPLRSCSDNVFRDYQRRGRPCIEYEMKRCAGPCVGFVEEAAYQELVQGTILFLNGRSNQLMEELTARMQKAADEERFEDAAVLRNRLGAVERTVEGQQIVVEKPVERDVFGLARQGDEVEVQVLHVREGRVVGTQAFGFSEVALDDGEVMSSFLGQYYGAEERRVPREVLCAAEFEDDGGLTALLEEHAGRRVDVRTPQRGPTRKLAEIAVANAEFSLAQRLGARESVDAALVEIQERCGLTRRPARIECYDVSNLQGTLAVASRVAFEEGKPSKKDYRRYRIKEAMAGDDYACLREVLTRRLARRDTEPLPDLLMVDGGRGQLGVVTAALEDLEIELDTLGLSKERDEDSPSIRVKRGGGLKAERIFRPGRSNPILLYPGSKALLLLQRVRDESHRFAIEFQRELRSKANLTSILEELPGIGPTKRRALLRELGSLRAVREASEAELRRVRGVSARDAALLASFFEAAREAELDPSLSADESSEDSAADPDGVDGSDDERGVEDAGSPGAAAELHSADASDADALPSAAASADERGDGDAAPKGAVK